MPVFLTTLGLALVVAGDSAGLRARAAMHPSLARQPIAAITASRVAPSRDASGGPGIVPAAVTDAWLGADKTKHFFVAGFAESVGFGVARTAGAGRDGALAAGVALGIAASVGKELIDRRAGGPFSVRDLAWDAAGLLAHGALLAQLPR